MAHLSHLHGPFLIQGVDLRYTNKPSVTSALRHGWSAEWSALPAPEAHIGVLNLSHYLTVFGFRVPGTTIDVEARQVPQSFCLLRAFDMACGDFHTITELYMLLRLCHFVVHAAAPSFAPHPFCHPVVHAAAPSSVLPFTTDIVGFLIVVVANRQNIVTP